MIFQMIYTAGDSFLLSILWEKKDHIKGNDIILVLIPHECGFEY
jgi:hypothetical protein